MPELGENREFENTEAENELLAANRQLKLLREEWQAKQERVRHTKITERDTEKITAGKSAWVSRPGHDLPQEAAPILKRALKKSGLAWAMRQGELFDVWAKTVGEEINDLTRLVSFRNGILSVDVYNNSLRQELQGFQKEAILSALREALPKKVLRDLRFQLGERVKE